MLISSYQERYARSTEKIRVLLNFLKEETET
ncbi:molybdopterin-guanine dinucleotide biosynthesis protein MobC, partial [Klebsiella pneumoniae]